ncbi:hypothetical protein [Sphingomonas radiodurans]|uniref:hypothetical protein n=1 Tax=Sphingomonas radiodurans TaxID=2890321 RepID=UPI001E3C4D04|nr:hypothetical protein [Sphingomonas radiodurans]WBH16446.1 hypothetical protein LLW23_16915 [Sphingomonas radiodurans]
MSDFEAVFATLRQTMLGVAGDQMIERDAPGDLVVRTNAIDAKTGKPGWFGTVTVKKSYVAYHLMPLYTAPELAEGISPALEKRRQGKTCFNFKMIDQALFDELAALTGRAHATLG